jgi:hypothetical protein
MKSVKLTAVRQLSGDYGVAKPGDHIEVSEEIAESLESRGLAVRGHVKLPETKAEQAVETVNENQAAERDEIETKARDGAPENKAIHPAVNKTTAKK